MTSIPTRRPGTPAYWIDGLLLPMSAAGVHEALAAAHRLHHRPICACKRQGPEMYVAKLGMTFIVKRMPGSGSAHAADCASYEPRAEVLAPATTVANPRQEGAAAGPTGLRPDPELTRPVTRTDPTANPSGRRSSLSGPKLTLRRLLYALWDRAELTRWQPSFAGRRSWATVRRRLLAAAEGNVACERLLGTCLYIPEVFGHDQSKEITARRTAFWKDAPSSETVRRPLMLLVGELRELSSFRSGYRAVIKHLPDRPFSLRQSLYFRTIQDFEQALQLWGSSTAAHMIMIATFLVSDSGVPTIEQLDLMPTSGQWIPVDDVFDLHLIDQLHATGRRYAKCLGNRFEKFAPSAFLLLDCSPPIRLNVERSLDAPAAGGLDEDGQRVWTWCAGRSAMPSLPSG